MAFQTGTSTDWKDLLADLQTLMVANGWVLEKTETSGDIETRYFRGPGSASNAPVHVNFRTGDVAVDGEYWLEVRGATAFDTTLTWDNQPNVSPSMYMPLWQNSIDYWFSVTDRRVSITANVSTSYFSLYAGFFLPFATPTDYPYPLYVAATSGTQPSIYTTTNSGLRSMADPGLNAAYVRQPGGTWAAVYNHGTDVTGDDDFEVHTGIGYYMWPYNNGSGSTNQDNDSFRAPDIRAPAAESTFNFIIPCHIAGTQADDGIIGFLEDVYWIPGFGLGAEQTFTLALARASETLTLTGQPLNTETVVVNTKTYTFQTTLTDTDGNVLIGATAADSLDNLINAVNLGPGAGIAYAASMTLNTTVYAEQAGTLTSEMFAKTPGTGGNSYPTTETLTNGSWGAATMSGGGASETYTIFPNVLRNNANHYYCTKNA